MSSKEPEQPAYIFPDPRLTLRAALAHHRALVPGLLDGGDAETAAIFAGHDAIHVVFGCSTSLVDEARADLWTMLATTMTLRRYSGYLNNPTVKALFLSYPLGQLILSFLAVFDTPRLWWRARQMTQPWDFDAWADHLDEPLGVIRARYNIRPVHAAAEGALA